jgi:hypothetical protein
MTTDQTPEREIVPTPAAARRHLTCVPDPEANPFSLTAPEGVDQEALEEFVRGVVYSEMQHVLKDVEFRLRQTREERERYQPINLVHDDPEDGRVLVRGGVYAEDLRLMKHFLTGYTTTGNGTTTITWAALHIVYNGVDYTITDGSSTDPVAQKYCWWDPTTPTVLQKSQTKPALTIAGSALIFINDAGKVIDVLQDTVASAIRDNSVDRGAVINGEIIAGKLGTDAVVQANLADSAVGNTELANNAITGPKIQPGQVTASKFNVMQHFLY